MQITTRVCQRLVLVIKLLLLSNFGSFLLKARMALVVLVKRCIFNWRGCILFVNVHLFIYISFCGGFQKIIILHKIKTQNLSLFHFAVVANYQRPQFRNSVICVRGMPVTFTIETSRRGMDYSLERVFNLSRLRINKGVRNG